MWKSTFGSASAFVAKSALDLSDKIQSTLTEIDSHSEGRKRSSSSFSSNGSTNVKASGRNGDANNGVELGEYYLEVMTEFMVEQMKLSREYGIIVAEKEAECSELRDQLSVKDQEEVGSKVKGDGGGDSKGEKGGQDEADKGTQPPPPPPPTLKQQSSSNTLTTSIESLHTKNEILTDTIKVWENKLHDLIKDKTRNTIQVKTLQNEVNELKSKRSTNVPSTPSKKENTPHTPIKPHSQRTSQTDSETIENLLNEYTLLSSTSSAQSELHELEICKLKILNEELGEKVEAGEKGMVLLADFYDAQSRKSYVGDSGGNGISNSNLTRNSNLTPTQPPKHAKSSNDASHDEEDENENSLVDVQYKNVIDKLKSDVALLTEELVVANSRVHTNDDIDGVNDDDDGSNVAVNEDVEKKHKSEINDLTYEHELKLRALQDEHRLEIKDMNDTRDTEIQKLKALGVEERSVRESSVNDASSELTVRHSDEITAMTDKHNDEIKLLNGRINDRDAEITSLVSNHASALDGLSVECERMKSELTDSHMNEINELAASHATKLTEVTNELSTDKQNEIDNLQASIGSESTLKHAAVLKEMNVIHRTAMLTLTNDLNKAHELKKNDLNKAHELKKNDLNKAHELDVDAVRGEWKAEVEELKCKHQLVLDEVGVKHGIEVEGVRGECDVKVNELNVANMFSESVISGNKKEHEGEIQGMRDHHATAIDTVNKGHDEHIKTINSTNKTAIDSLTDSLTDTHNSAVEVLNGKINEITVKLTNEHEQDIDNLKSSNEKTMTTLSSSHTTAIAGLNETHGKAITSLITSQSNKHNNVITEVNEKHENAVADLTSFHDTTVTALTDKHANDVTELKAKHENTVHSINSDNDKKMVWFETKTKNLLASFESDKAQLLSDHAVVLAGVNGVREQALKDLDNVEERWIENQRVALETAMTLSNRLRNEAIAATRQSLQAEITQSYTEKEEYKQLYTLESKRRKLIHNRLIELTGNIRVIARVRPSVPEEDKHASDGGDTVVVECISDTDIVVHRDQTTKTRYEFDVIHSKESTQEEVYGSVSEVIVSVLDGYNVCIFAYGQTGSGKTYTMDGTPNDRGVNYRAIDELFSLADERRENVVYTFELAMVEVYNESVRDLISPTYDQFNVPTSLKISHTEKEGITIHGLSRMQVDNSEDVYSVLQKAMTNRSVGSHNMNTNSSRSHLILTVTVHGKDIHNGSTVHAKLNLIDLAGSERIGKTDASGEQLKEAQNINKSLSALGDVINALASASASKKKDSKGNSSAHVPFRNSKLTFLLMDSLAGNSKVMMFVNISPVFYNMPESICSLAFASRCRAVELGSASANSSSNRGRGTKG